MRKDEVWFLSLLAMLFVAGTLLQLGDYFLMRQGVDEEDNKFFARVTKKMLTLIRCVRMLLLPALFSVAIVAIWQVELFARDLHLHEKFEGIGTAGWVTITGILYSLIVTTILGNLWEEYKRIRMAVKQYDLDTFMDLRDEELSPLVYLLLFVLSMFVLGGLHGS